jgi:hypothetical protein
VFSVVKIAFSSHFGNNPRYQFAAHPITKVFSPARFSFPSCTRAISNLADPALVDAAPIRGRPKGFCSFTTDNPNSFVPAILPVSGYVCPNLQAVVL